MYSLSGSNSGKWAFSVILYIDITRRGRARNALSLVIIGSVKVAHVLLITDLIVKSDFSISSSFVLVLEALGHISL